jgi:hypothetical protein
MKIGEIEEGDSISIDTDALCGPLWEVVSVRVDDIGLSKIRTVALVSDSDGICVAGVPYSDQYEVFTTEDSTSADVCVAADDISRH